MISKKQSFTVAWGVIIQDFKTEEEAEIYIMKLVSKE